MARDHARVWLSIWSDDDFRALTPQAQHLYFVLLTSPSLSYCGVADWRPGRIAANASGWTATAVRSAGAELVRGLFAVIDEDSEEVLLRTFIRNDGVMKNPNVAMSMALAFGGTASLKLRGVIVHELNRLHDTAPDLKGWSKPNVAALLDRKAIDPASYPFGYPTPEEVDQPVSEPLPEGVGYPFPKGVHQGVDYPLDQGVGQPFGLGETEGTSLGVPQGFPSLPAPAPAPAPLGGHLTGVRHQGAANDSNDPPPRFHSGHESGYEHDCDDCTATYEAREAWLLGLIAAAEPSRTCERHPKGTESPCRACGTARETHERWQRDRERAAAERKQAEARKLTAERTAETQARRAAIAECTLGCRERDGYTPDGRVCHHDPDEADRAQRGMATVRAALAKREASTP